MHKDGHPPEARYARAFALADAYRTAIAQGTAEPLPSFLARHPDLRELLSALLGGADTSGPAAPELPEPPAAAAPTAIGPFRILGLLGEGGMGTVYLAEQTAPVRRRVALKVIRFGVDSTAMLARFERERQVLARMNHDAIARVFEVGTTATGQPFIAMEPIEQGQWLTRWCDARRLSIRARLELFQRVCAGVQHAHEKGVLHRDLKPGNVLVQPDSGNPTPKIIDFGLAQAIDRRSLPPLTEHGAVAGTRGYMAPEQEAGEIERVSTRSDVFSLGVMLHELLTGDLPGVDGDNPDTSRRPSDHVSTLGDRAAPHAERRGLTPRSLVAALRGDLDWIVLRATAREPERRYASPAELAFDLQRHLDHQPVLAGPPSTAYRLQKFLWRNRRRVAAGAMLTVLATAATVLVFANQRFAWAAAVDRTRGRAELSAAIGRLHNPTLLGELLPMGAVTDPASTVRAADLRDAAHQRLLAVLNRYATTLHDHGIREPRRDLLEMLRDASPAELEQWLDHCYWIDMSVAAARAADLAIEPQAALADALAVQLATEPRPHRQAAWAAFRQQSRGDNQSFGTFVDTVDPGAWSAADLEWLTLLMVTARQTERLDAMLAAALAKDRRRFYVRFLLAQRTHGAERLSHLEAAVTIDPGSSEAWHNYGWSLQNIREAPFDRPADAAACYRRAIAFDPGNWRARLNLTYLVPAPEAVALLGDGIRLTPSAVLYARLVDREREAGDVGRALEAADRGLTLFPGSPGLWSLQGEMLCWLGRFAEARPVLEHAINLDPDQWQPRNHYFVAVTQLWVAGKTATERRDLQALHQQIAAEGFERFPDNGFLALNQAKALMNSMRMREAKPVVDTAIRLLVERIQQGDGEARRVLLEFRDVVAGNFLYQGIAQQIDKALPAR